MSASLPEAYKAGTKNFYGRDFIVSRDVLIPRPETEIIIDEVLSLAGKPFLPGVIAPERKIPDRPRIIDVGTGSGCIAISLKKELSESKIYGLDISKSALSIARKNAEKMHAEVEFLESDLLNMYNDEEPDVVIANLPYVDPDWKWLDKKALSFEPSIALFAEDSGLKLIKILLDQIINRGWKPFVILEADPCQHLEIIKYAQNSGFEHIKTNGFVLIFN